MRPRRYIPEYTMPAIDSPRARAAATLFLLNARSIEHLTAERFAHQMRLKPATAERMIEAARKRRG